MYIHNFFNNLGDDDGMLDPNEQEQYKDMQCEPPKRKKFGSENENIMAESDRSQSLDTEPLLSHDDETKNITEISPIENNTTPPAKIDDTDKDIYAFKWDYIEKDSKKKAKNSVKNQKVAKNTGLLFPTAVMGISFLLAFMALSSAFIMQKPHVADVAQSTTTDATDDGKIIYVREDVDGINLTPTEIYSACAPSVVSIRATSSSAEGIGTGFVFASDGYIATASHVVSGMDSISVIFSDGKNYSASLIGADEKSDIALLKIDATDLTAAKIGDSSSLLIGEEIIAIGTPASLEFSGTMTRGDISFCNRQLFVYDNDSGALEKKMFLIQTSAALNPGNSGGPIFNLRGEVVGIVSMKLGNGFDGIAFAIPSSPAAKILDAMKNGLGIPADEQSKIAVSAPKLCIICKDYAENNIYGVIINDFSEEESDARKKLRKGDVIVSINDIPVTSGTSLSEQIRKYNPSDTVKITLWRNGQLLSFDVILK